MFGRRRPSLRLETERLVLRLPEMADQGAWARLRRESAGFLKAWEPLWARDHLTRPAFRNRVSWARRTLEEGRGAPLFIFEREGERLLGAITLDNVRRGPAQSGTVGYWIGADFAGRGYMTEALGAVRDHAFDRMDLSRLEAACLPENQASRALLERCGFKYEGVAQSYLQIAGRWRTHVLYAALRWDRRGRAEDR
ncbi:MAG TPA: GNAT family protein [Paracoccaceae bacterium]|nr:GNAT family protein [Paracoccaceae bacterium]